VFCRSLFVLLSFSLLAIVLFVPLSFFLLAIVLFIILFFFYWPLYCLLFCSFSIGHCIVCYFVLFLLAIVLFVILFFFCWPLYCLLFCSFSIGHCIACYFVLLILGGPGWLNELGSWITNNSYKPITNMAWVYAWLCKLQKRVHLTRSHKW
jgi:hypothetical protein